MASTTSPAHETPADIDVNSTSQDNEVEYLSLNAMSGVDVSARPVDRAVFPARLMRDVVQMNFQHSISQKGSHTSLPANTSSPSIETLSDIAQLLLRTDRSRFCEGYHVFSSAGLQLPLYDSDVRTGTEDNFIASSVTESILPSGFAGRCLTRATILLTMRPTGTNVENFPTVSDLTALMKYTNNRLSSEGESSEQIHCLFLQALVAMYHQSAPSSWHLLGLAITKAIARGLHNKSVRERSVSENDANCDIFWNLFVMDRTMALVMDRPFSIDGGDITLELPCVSSEDQSELSRTIGTIQVWIVQYMNMLSQWRVSGLGHLTQYFGDYKYWRRRSNELVEDVTSLTADKHADTNTLLTFVLRYQYQLSSRALLQLSRDLVIQHSESQTVWDIRNEVSKEIPSFVTYLKQTVEVQNQPLNMFDAYDVFGAALLYIRSKYRGEEALSLGIAEFRMLNTCTEILQNFATAFPVFAEYKDIIWGFMTALEEIDQCRTNPSKFEEVASRLRCQIAKTSVPVPTNLITIMLGCFQR